MNNKRGESTSVAPARAIKLPAKCALTSYFRVPGTTTTVNPGHSGIVRAVNGTMCTVFIYGHGEHDVPKDIVLIKKPC